MPSALSIIFDIVLTIMAVTTLRTVEAVLHWRIGPHLVTGSELKLERQVAGLQHEVGQLKEQNFEAIRRESVGLRQIAELQETIRNLTLELENLRSGHERLRQTVAGPSRRLLVALGADPHFQIDLAALRAVRSRTGMEFLRLTGVSRKLLAAHLDRNRLNGRPFGHLHLGVHGSDEGLAFADGLVSWEWLSGVLDGVQVLLLASCSSTKVGDWLGVGPWVVSLSGGVTLEDGARFTQAFWSEIGNGAEPPQALSTALDRSPAQLQEFVIAHW